MAKSTTSVWWSKGTHVWLDGTWFKRSDRLGWFVFTAFYAPPVAAVLWCQFLCVRSIKWSPVSGVSLRFPPVSLVGPVLRFLRSHGRSCTVMALNVYPKRYWWPLIQSCASKSCRLAVKGEAGRLLLPSKQGWIPHPGIPGISGLLISILFHNTQLLALIVIKIWENWSSALEEVETVIDSRPKHEFLAKKGLGRVGRSTFLLGADQRLSGEGVFNGIYYCPLGFRAPCTCIPLCIRPVICFGFALRFWVLWIVSHFTTLNYTRSLLLRYGKIDMRANQLRFHNTYYKGNIQYKRP